MPAINILQPVCVPEGTIIPCSQPLYTSIKQVGWFFCSVDLGGRGGSYNLFISCRNTFPPVIPAYHPRSLLCRVFQPGLSWVFLFFLTCSQDWIQHPSKVLPSPFTLIFAIPQLYRSLLVLPLHHTGSSKFFHQSTNNRGDFLCCFLMVTPHLLANTFQSTQVPKLLGCISIRFCLLQFLLPSLQVLGMSLLLFLKLTSRFKTQVTFLAEYM